LAFFSCATQTQKAKKLENRARFRVKVQGKGGGFGLQEYRKRFPKEVKDQLKGWVVEKWGFTKRSGFPIF